MRPFFFFGAFWDDDEEMVEGRMELVVDASIIPFS